MQAHAQTPIRTVVIVGGGTSGWMTAAALAKILQGKFTIQLVESDDIGTIGVGEATIPMIRRFNHILEIDEDEFMRETQATFKLGIEFVNWGHLGDRYTHGFGNIGQQLWTAEFHDYWLKMWLAGEAPDLERYSIKRMASKANKFMRADPNLPNSPLTEITHAFHFDFPSGDLPAVRGGDDADKARWIALGEALEMGPQLFEDHLSIIEYFVGRG